MLLFSRSPIGAALPVTSRRRLLAARWRCGAGQGWARWLSSVAPPLGRSGRIPRGGPVPAPSLPKVLCCSRRTPAAEDSPAETSLQHPGPGGRKRKRDIFSLFIVVIFFPLMNSVKFGQLTVVLPAAGGGTPIREEKNSEKVNLRRAYTHSPSAASDPSSPQLRVPMPESSSERQEKLRALVRQCCRGSSRDSALSGGGLEGGRGRIR